MFLSIHDHSLIILDDKAPKETGIHPSTKSNSATSSTSSLTSSTKSDHATTTYLDNYIVTKIIAIEWPKAFSQLYAASGLRDKFHFSIPTVAIPILFKVIKNTNCHSRLSIGEKGK